MKQLRIVAGIAVWIAALVFGFQIAFSTPKEQTNRPLTPSPAGGMTTWLTTGTAEFEIEAASPVTLAVGDPVFIQRGSGVPAQVGVVIGLEPPKAIAPPTSNTGIDPAQAVSTTKSRPVTTASILVYGDARSSVRDCILEYHTTPTGLDWVVKTMLPPERRRAIAAELEKEWNRNRDDMIAALEPIVMDAVRKSMDVLEEDIPAAVRNHREELKELGDRYQQEIVATDIIPLVRREIVPIVERNLQPLARDVGEDLWDRVSLWSFAWRAAYDAVPFTSKTRVRTEFDRFLEKEAVPLMESRSGEFVQVIEATVREASRNPKVREVFSDSMNEVLRDPDFQKLLWQIIRESIVENERLRETLVQHWNSPEAKQAVRMAGGRLEPVVRRIGDMMFGTRESGITPEFARVLRSQILLKDRQWLVLVPDTASAPDGSVSRERKGPVPVVRATTQTQFPLRFRGPQLPDPED